LIAADTTVLVAAFSAWHIGHGAANAALGSKTRIPAHALIESYSVLTRLPPPHRAAPDAVASFLLERFPEPPLTLPAKSHRALVREVERLGLPGGMVYDALIAATARHASASLLTRDRRAIPVYEMLGADYVFVD
jgi:predicted nucleic acid-binding protein